ncbi:MAG: T9SS type A sorting domain-containing protein [Bacteroidetes bacterium]|nr:T9SS type A sorting domain-containing protein [Bacteroidota bacterium]
MKKAIFFLVLVFSSFTFLLAQQNKLQGRIYVKTGSSGDGSSWSNAAGNLSTVLQNASNSEIWVAAGTYKADNTDATTSFILNNGNYMFGGFLGNEASISERATSDVDGNGTIEPWEFTNASILTGELQGDADSSNNTHHILRMLQGDNHTLIDGFTITNGYSIDSIASGIIADSGYIRNCIVNNCGHHSHNEDETIHQVYGAGIAAFKSNLGYVKVTNCTSVPVNVASWGVGTGGGIYSNMSTLENCTVSNCRIIPAYYTDVFGGCLFANQSSINNCTFSEGYLSSNDGNYGTYGGGVALANGCLMKNSEIRNCSSKTFGGGIYTENSNILNCNIHDNQVYGPEMAEIPSGGGIYIYNGNLTGSLIAKNRILEHEFSRSYGAGIYGGTIINCTVVKNSGAIYGDGIYAPLSVVNSIFWGNENDEGIDGGLNNAIQGATDLTNGTIILEAENSGNEAGKYYPWFIDPESNWDIGPSSSCINMGTTDPPTQIGTTDLLSRIRVYGGRIDIGAYEVNSFQGIAPAGISHYTIYPNPAKDIITICGSTPPKEITVYSVSGECVSKVKPDKQGRINIKRLDPGVYIIHTSDSESIPLRFIKQ